MQIWWIEPSVLCAANNLKIVGRESVNLAELISPQPIAKLRCRMRPRPQT
jgi:hypothetical protein